MRVAVVKQTLDVHGPWSTVRWSEKTPRALLDLWPGKATHWEMTCCLEADWYVIPQKVNTAYTYDSVLSHPGRRDLVLKHTANQVRQIDIPIEDYELIITFDPILDIPEKVPQVFAYYVQEHWDPRYRQSLSRPLGGYDLMLAHMMNAAEKLDRLPQSVSFPYLRAPSTMRGAFPVEKEHSLWVDWRTLAAMVSSKTWNDRAEAEAERFSHLTGLPVRFKAFTREGEGYGISDPPRWGDGARYLEQLAASKFYLSVGPRIAGGQGLCDAASLGSIVFGDASHPFHCLVCHPTCISRCPSEVVPRIRKVTENVELHDEILEYQDQALETHFVRKPIDLLRTAIDLKLRSSSADS